MMSSGQAPPRLVLAAASVALLSGCSFLFVDAPPANRAPTGHVACTRSRAAPIIDTAIAVFQVVRTGWAIAQSEDDYRDFPISRGADIGFGVGLTALFAASAVHGYATTSACEKAQDEAAASLAAPPPLATAGGEVPAAIRPAGPTPPLGAPATESGCRYDAECSGDELCREGRCQPP